MPLLTSAGELKHFGRKDREFFYKAKEWATGSGVKEDGMDRTTPKLPTLKSRASGQSDGMAGFFP